MSKSLLLIICLSLITLSACSYTSNTGSNEAAPGSTTGNKIADKAPQAKTNVVTYNENGYSPSSIQIKKGETVTFKNNSDQGMWTASSIHPTHTVYPTTGGCIGSTFDSCKSVLKDDEWSFTFDEVGVWKYHNHLKATDFGEIVVSE